MTNAYGSSNEVEVSTEKKVGEPGKEGTLSKEDKLTFDIGALAAGVFCAAAVTKVTKKLFPVICSKLEEKLEGFLNK